MSSSNLSSIGAESKTFLTWNDSYRTTLPLISLENASTGMTTDTWSIVNNAAGLELMTALSTLTSDWTANVSNGTLSPAECQAKLDNFKKREKMLFDHASLVRVLLSWTLFLISAIGNCFVLTSLTIRRRRKAISHSQLIMMHLTIANLLFTVFIIPFDAIWQTTQEWYGGDVLCRLTNVLKQFAMYSSSAMVVVMGIDRVVNLMCPKPLPAQRKRIRTMLTIAWIFCVINAIPAGFIFSVVEMDLCPEYAEYSVVQCVDLEIRNIAKLGAYYVYTMFVSFFGPLICILVCYILIALAISKMARLAKEAQRRCLKQQPSSNKTCQRVVSTRGLDRARRVSLVVTGLITFTFIICWGPYYVTGLIEWFGHQSMSRTGRDVMLMSMYLNPMLHPLITVWLMKEIRENIMTQCRRTGRRSSSRKTNRNNQPVIVKLENNGLLAPNGKNGVNAAKREWL